MLRAKDIAKDQARFYSMTRRDFLSVVDIPKITRSTSLEYVNTCSNSLSKGFQKDILPPLSDLTQIGVTLEGGKHAGVVVNKTFFFDKADIDASKLIHRINSLKQTVGIENRWFSRMLAALLCPDGITFQNHQSVVKFQEILLDNYDDRCLSPEKNLLTSDLALLVGNNWVNLALIKCFVDLINNKLENQICVTLSELEDFHKSNQLTQKVQQWLASAVYNICVIANAGRKMGSTYFTSGKAQGNHWVCFSINIKSKEIIYCDSLAWSAPKKFPKNVSFLATVLELIDPNSTFSTIYAHKNEVPPKKVHRCNDLCLKLPYQGPNMNICGLASLVSAIILTEPSLDVKRLPKHMDWFRRIYEYSDFVRSIFINWFVNNKVVASDIMQTEKDKESTGLKINPQSDGEHKTEGDEDVISDQRQNLNGWHLFMHEKKMETEGDFGECSKTLKRSWRELESDERSEYNSKAKMGITIDPCKLCGARFSQLKRKHEHDKSCGKKFDCSDCGKVYMSEKSLRGHRAAKHTKENQCETCLKCFENMSKLTRHRVVHEKSQSFICDICSKSYGRKDNLLYHKKKVHKM